MVQSQLGESIIQSKQLPICLKQVLQDDFLRIPLFIQENIQNITLMVDFWIYDMKRGIIAL